MGAVGLEKEALVQATINMQKSMNVITAAKILAILLFFNRFTVCIDILRFPVIDIERDDQKKHVDFVMPPLPALQCPDKPFVRKAESPDHAATFFPSLTAWAYTARNSSMLSALGTLS